MQLRINQISAAFAIDGFDYSHQILLEPIRIKFFIDIEMVLQFLIYYSY